MRYDFSLVEDEDNLATIPEGVYLCRVAEVRDGRARDGSVQWGIRLEVAEGEYAGRTAAWDRLTWSERGVRRVKRVLAALGFDVDGPLEIAPEDLVGRAARVAARPPRRAGQRGAPGPVAGARPQAGSFVQRR